MRATLISVRDTAVIPISQCGLIHVLLVLHKNKNEPEQVNSKIR